MPTAKERMIFKSGLEGVIPFGEVVVVAIMLWVKPCPEEFLECRVGFFEKTFVLAFFVELPCQRGKKWRSKDLAALPRKTGFMVYDPLFILDGYEIF